MMAFDNRLVTNWILANEMKSSNQVKCIIM